MTEELELTSALLRCPSVTPQHAGALDLVQNWLMAQGFTCQRIEGQSESYTVDNLYARWGSKAPVFGFCGHVDVVPVGDEHAWRHPPFAGIVENEKLYGRGAVDMKSGLACFMLAAARFIVSNPNFEGSIAFLVTGDEEAEAQAGTLEILRWMEKAGEKLDHCLVGEPSSRSVLGDTVKIGRRGSFNAWLDVVGKQGHVAYPSAAQNPIPPLLMMLSSLLCEPLDAGTEYFEPSMVQITSVDVGNKTMNMVPNRASAALNIRFNDHWNPKTLEAELRRRFDRSCYPYDLKWQSNADAFIFPPDALGKLVARAIKEVTDQSPDFMTNGGTSDARFISRYCPVVEFGAVGSTLHQVDEHVTLAELVPLSAIYQRVLERYFL